MALSRYTATIVFQFTPLREGRQISITPNKSIEDFNSRPSARGDAEKDYLPNPFTISIHAPPRGATENRFLDKPVLQFQFTPLREGRLEKSGNVSKEYVISIHAPPRGATSRRDSLTNGRRIDFNSRPSARGDNNVACTWGVCHNFNSRPSARGDRKPKVAQFNFYDFNSRPSARGDAAAALDALTADLFQFTPLREGRQARLQKRRFSKLFQFTPLREGRRAGTVDCAGG